MPCPYSGAATTPHGTTTPQQLDAGDGLSPASRPVGPRVQARTVHPPLYSSLRLFTQSRAEAGQRGGRAALLLPNPSRAHPPFRARVPDERASGSGDTCRLRREKKGMATFLDHHHHRPARELELPMEGFPPLARGRRGRCSGGAVAFPFVQPTMGTLTKYLARGMVSSCCFLPIGSALKRP